jgi:hypothetical protein
MTERINARLDGDLAGKLDYLRQRTGATTTEVLRASLEAYFEQVKSRDKPEHLLARFIGCAEGPEDLSSTYKAEVTQSLATKVG